MDIDTALKVLAPAGATIAFLIGLFQWIDLRKREVQARRFDQFHRAFEWVAGRTATGQSLVDTQQAMATYELANFPEYRATSLPIIEYYLNKTNGEPDSGLFRKALLGAKQKLEAHG
jgi:hypothetical protein